MKYKSLSETIKDENEKLKQQIKEANKIIIEYMNYMLDYEGGWTEASKEYANKYGIDIVDGKWKEVK